MDRHLLHNIEVNETAETEEISLIVLAMDKEEIDTNTEMNEKSNESFCSNGNDNSIPFCNILLSKFLDLTPENDLIPEKNEPDTRTAAEKCEKNAAAESRDKEQNKKKLYESQRRYRERKKLENIRPVDPEVAINKRKKHAEIQRYYRMKKYQDIEVAIKERKKEAERQRHYRAMQKTKINELQVSKKEVDIEVLIKKRKQNAERQKRYVERKKSENYELFMFNERKKQAQKRYKQRQKKKENELQNGNKQVDVGSCSSE